VLPALLRELDRDGRTVRTAELARPTLDDVFLRLTGRSLREERADASGPDPAPEATGVGAPR
jgi:ABC-2 type transport system ATP-binding protein